MMHKIALVAAIMLPLWNIPLIVRIIKRKSSEDISVAWAIGIWVCIVFMAPSGFTSADMVWRTFNIVNFVLFSFVLATVLIYHKKRGE